MPYAKRTKVPIDHSRSEIEKMISKHGATSFVSGRQGNRSQIVFELHNRRVRFVLDLPAQPASGNEQTRWEQFARAKWRALSLAIKAKLVAVEEGIFTFDEEFMPYVVLPTGLTIGETLMPDFDRVTSTGKLPPLLPGPGQSTAR